MGRIMKIGKLAKEANVTPRTIRYYEELGLISPCKYTEGGVRLYSELELIRLRLIHALKELSYSLEDIKLVLLPESGQKKSPEKILIKNLEKQFNETDKNINRFIELKNEIEYSNGVLKTCLECNKKPGFMNCSECADIPQGQLPRTLKAVF